MMRRHKDQREAMAEDSMAAARRVVGEMIAEKRRIEEATDQRSAIEAELDQHLFRFELAYRLRARPCAAPRSCTKHRSRRLGCCRELAKTRRHLEVHRTRMAAERARTGKPVPQPLPKQPGRQTNH
jgi:hypothetical protein